MSRGRALAWAVPGLLACSWLVVGCRDSAGETGAQPVAQASEPASLDRGALRASAVDGLEASVEQPGAELGLARALASPELAPARAALVERVSQDPGLARSFDELLARVQESEGMRALVVEQARAHPERTPAELAAQLPEQLLARLTRPEVLASLTRALSEGAAALEPGLAAALMREGGGAQVLAKQAVARLEQPPLAGAVREALGRDLEGAQQRLERRLADPRRAAGLLTSLARFWASEQGRAQLASLLGQPACAAELARLGRELAGSQAVRARLLQLFSAAIAAEIDARGLADALEAALAEPELTRALEASERRLAADPALAQQLQAALEAYASTPAFEAALLAWVGAA